MVLLLPRRFRCFHISFMKNFRCIGIVVCIFVFAIWKIFHISPAKNVKSKFVIVETNDYKRFRNIKERIVHFDLKGAPPRVPCFNDFFSLLSQFGANGVLIEYEDMFPYNHSLKLVRNNFAYSVEDVQKILYFAKSNGLFVIPLIQTFGHLEFMLKLSEFSSLREIANYPQVICPSNDKSYSILFEMIDQVVALHPDIKAIHIGADEAYYIGRCQRCKHRLQTNFSNNLDEFVLDHVLKVASYIQKRHRLRVLMWHDMLVGINNSLIVKYQLFDYVEPVIWKYNPDLPDNFRNGSIFHHFSQSFLSVYAATAFKGANGPDQTFVDVERYLQNHVAWINAMNRHDSMINFSGVILTGWQRFDHFAILCELLPVAIPSLVLSLLTVEHGGMLSHADILHRARRILNCNDTAYENSDNSSLLSDWSKCTFPYHEVYRLVQFDLRLLRINVQLMFESSAHKGWLSEYNLIHGYSQTYLAEKAFNLSVKYQKEFIDLGTLLRKELSKLYFDDTLEEWLFENIQVYINRLKRIQRYLLPIIQTSAFSTRPFARVELDF